MKKILSLLIFALSMGATSAHAQDKKPEMTPEQRMEHHTQRVARKLNLDDKTAVKFTEIYKRYLTEMHGLRDKYQPLRPEAGTLMTDEQVEQNLLNRFARSRAILDVREKYYREFRKVLNVRQVERIYGNEHDNFKRFHRPTEKGKTHVHPREPRHSKDKGGKHNHRD